MPPRRFSRFEFTRAIRDANGKLLLTDREPFRYQPFEDNRVHRVKQGETLYTLAGRFFRPRPRACGYWWVIADFQPDPIVDPTVALDIGRQIYIPSLRTLDEQVLSEARRSQVDG